MKKTGESSIQQKAEGEMLRAYIQDNNLHTDEQPKILKEKKLR